MKSCLPAAIVCAHCGVSFRPRSRTTKYCGKLCQTAYRRKPKLAVIEKRCSLCRQVKPASAFHASSKSHTGLQAQCIVCQKTRVRRKELTQYSCSLCGQLRNRFKWAPSQERKRQRVCLSCARRVLIEQNSGHSLNYTGSCYFAGRLLASWKGSAKRRGHRWNLSKEQLDNQFIKQNGRCALSGLQMEWQGEQRKNKSPYRASIDRIDSNEGYVPGNFQFVCSIVNVMKNKLHDTEFRRLCRLITEYTDTLEDDRGKTD